MLKEHIGLGTKFSHDAGDYGVHTLNVSTFFKDTLLSGSLMHNRGSRNKSDGGLANTEKFNSMVLAGRKRFLFSGKWFGGGFVLQIKICPTGPWVR